MSLSHCSISPLFLIMGTDLKVEKKFKIDKRKVDKKIKKDNEIGEEDAVKEMKVVSIDDNLREISGDEIFERKKIFKEK